MEQSTYLVTFTYDDASNATAQFLQRKLLYDILGKSPTFWHDSDWGDSTTWQCSCNEHEAMMVALSNPHVSIKKIEPVYSLLSESQYD